MFALGIFSGVLTQTTQPASDWGAHCVISHEVQEDMLVTLWGVRVTGSLGPQCVVLGSALRTSALSTYSSGGRGGLQERRRSYHFCSFDVRRAVQAWCTRVWGCGQRDRGSGEDTGPWISHGSWSECLQSVEICTAVIEGGLNDALWNAKRQSALVAKLWVRGRLFQCSILETSH